MLEGPMEMQDVQGKNARDLYGDFLRVILMMMIVLQHSIVHGLGVVKLRDGIYVDISGGVLALNSFAVVSVNCFFWISGFYKIQYNNRKLLKIILEVLFYVVVINLVLLVVSGTDYSTLGIVGLLKRSIGFLGNYWFMDVYFVLYVLSNYLNRLIEHLGWNEALKLIVLLFAINTLYGFLRDWGGIGTGYSVVQGIYLYLIGRICSVYLRKVRELVPYRTVFLLAYVLSCTVTAVLTVIFYNMTYSSLAWKMWAYNNPLVVIGSVSLCLFVTGRKSKEKGLIAYVATWAPFTLAIYLISDYYALRNYVFWPMNSILSRINGNQCLTITLLLANAVCISFVCMAIDRLRSILFTGTIRFMEKGKFNNV